MIDGTGVDVVTIGLGELVGRDVSVWVALEIATGVKIFVGVGTGLSTEIGKPAQETATKRINIIRK